MVRGQCHTLEMALEEAAIIVGQLLPGAARAQMAAQRRNDERLDLGGGNAADQSGRRGLILQHGLGDVIAVAGAALVGVGWAHAVAAMVKKAPAQERGRAPQLATPRPPGGARGAPRAGSGGGRPGPNGGPPPPEKGPPPTTGPCPRQGPPPGKPPPPIKKGFWGRGAGPPPPRPPPPMVRPFDSR